MFLSRLSDMTALLQDDTRRSNLQLLHLARLIYCFGTRAFGDIAITYRISLRAITRYGDYVKDHNVVLSDYALHISQLA